MTTKPWMIVYVKFLSVVCFVLICACLLLMTMAFRTPGVGEVTLYNKTGGVIERLDLEVGGLQFSFKDVPDAGKVELVFPITHTCDYNVKASIKDGGVVQGKVGYLESSLKPKDEIVVSPAKVELNPRS